MFKEPQVSQRRSRMSSTLTTDWLTLHLSLLPKKVFYMWKKKKECLQEVNDLAKKLLIKVRLSLQLQPPRFERHNHCAPLLSGEL